ncbi:MAG: ATP-binding protein [Planctomycetes bacterium]|nr:ATP-binding protein [Planctomycetota bacterium]
MDELPVGELTITNDSGNLARVRQFMSDVLQKTALGVRERNLVVLAVDEAVANVVEHAYEEGQVGEIGVSLLADATRVVVHIKDAGKPFDPREVGAVDIRAHVAARRKDGLGIFMIKKIMDEVEYRFLENRNRLELVKFVKPPATGTPVAAPGSHAG